MACNRWQLLHATRPSAVASPSRAQQNPAAPRDDGQAELARHLDACVAAVKKGVVESVALYGIISQRHGDSRVHRAALHALWRLLLWGGAPARERAHKLRTTRAVCDALLLQEASACDQDVVAPACRVLLELLTRGECSRCGEPVVAELLTALPGIVRANHNATAHIAALQLLQALAPCRIMAPAAAAAVDCVKVTMQRFPQNAEAQQAACEALCVMTCSHTKEARAPPRHQLQLRLQLLLRVLLLPRMPQRGQPNPPTTWLLVLR